MKKITIILSILFSLNFHPIFPQKLVELNQLIQNTFEKSIVPGVLVGVSTPDTTYCLAFGESDTIKHTLLTPEHAMMGGSTGKVPVAAVLLQLVQENKLNIDDQIKKYFFNETWFNKLPNHECLTIRNLMMHRSGIERYIFTDFVKDVKKDKAKVWKAEELIGYVLNKEPAFKCDSAFQYSDTNYILLGMIIEKITKKSYYSNLYERIINPLRLKTFHTTDTDYIQTLSNGYSAENDEINMPGPALDKDHKANYNWQFEWTGGGLAYNPKDFSHFLLKLFNNEILEEDLMKEMFTTKNAPEIQAKYGLGIMEYPHLGTNVYGHSGFFPGYYTQSQIWVKKNIAITWQINSTNMPHIRKTYVSMNEVMRYIAQEYR